MNKSNVYYVMKIKIIEKNKCKKEKINKVNAMHINFKL